METTNFQSELFNINYENLQEFLEKMVNVINTHAKTIGVLEDQLKTKVMLPQVVIFLILGIFFDVVRDFIKKYFIFLVVTFF